MNRSKVMALAGLGLLAVISLLSAQQNNSSPQMGAMTSQPAAGGMAAMHGKMLDDIFAHVDAADAALTANDTAKAKAELTQAKTMIAQWRQMGAHHPTATMASDKLSNAKCPIMLIPVSEPIRPELTRQFKGTKIGFCCSSCPPQWDKLSDAEKETKLKAVGWTGPAGS